MDGKLGLRFALVAILAVVMMVQFAEAGYYGYGKKIKIQFFFGFKKLLKRFQENMLLVFANRAWIWTSWTWARAR